MCYGTMSAAVRPVRSRTGPGVSEIDARAHATRIADRIETKTPTLWSTSKRNSFGRPRRARALRPERRPYRRLFRTVVLKGHHQFAVEVQGQQVEAQGDREQTARKKGWSRGNVWLPLRTGAALF